MLDFVKNIGTTEIIVLVLILLVLFGARAVVSLGKASGETVRELKGIKKEFNKALQDDGSESGKS
jgi:Sec-independent protein translocase protein TatA